MTGQGCAGGSKKDKRETSSTGHNKLTVFCLDSIQTSCDHLCTSFLVGR